MTRAFALTALLALATAACAQSYTSDTYSASAVQQANKVERAVVVGFRQVKISANGTVGAVTGGAAGGILGSQSKQVGFNAALGTVGGTALGSIIGTTIEHVTGDTKGWEYIVQKKNGDLLSVTQQDEKPLPIGHKVLVITGSQARIIADYSVEPPPPSVESPPPAPAPEAAAAPTTLAPAPQGPAPGTADTAPAAPAAVKPTVSEQPAPPPSAPATP